MNHLLLTDGWISKRPLPAPHLHTAPLLAAAFPHAYFYSFWSTVGPAMGPNTDSALLHITEKNLGDIPCRYIRISLLARSTRIDPLLHANQPELV